MPRDGAWWLSEMTGHKIEFYCEKCTLSGSYDAQRILAALGDITMPNLLDELAEREGCQQVRTLTWNDKCNARYTRSPEALMGITPREGGAQLGDLPQWKQLIAVCGACQKKKPLDRRTLERRFGREATPQNIATRLKCYACGNKDGNRIELINLPR